MLLNNLKFKLIYKSNSVETLFTQISYKKEIIISKYIEDIQNCFFYSR